jgi:tetratricopeptide (TPR) repeat protein
MGELNMESELFLAERDYVPLTKEHEECITRLQDINDPVRIKMIVEAITPSYIRARRFDEMLNALDALAERPEMRVIVPDLLLNQGGLCEAKRAFGMAIEYYKEGIAHIDAHGAEGHSCAYWFPNNLSFCYDYEAMFQEAQSFADKAIAIDHRRHNAWKNLGISVEHQHRHAYAAICYIVSHIQCAGNDKRPLKHLERMFKRNPGLESIIADSAPQEIEKAIPGLFMHFYLGETYYRCGEMERAVLSFGEFLNVAPAGYSECLQYANARISEIKQFQRLEKQFQ